ncbi:MAG: hypothetical protein D6715_04020 [Calditrichaeota bacterium]|nr:MAG: hypothetical protein D6715_04020 [Calditrichota bacterium]
MADIRGLVLQSRFDFLEQEQGEGAVQRLKERLTPEHLPMVAEQIFPVNLYPFALLQDIDRALLEVTGTPEEALFSRVGSHLGLLLADRYFYNYIEGQNPQGLLDQLGRLYPYLIYLGGYTVAHSGQGQSRVAIHYPEPIHRPYCLALQHALAAMLTRCRAEALTWQEDTCAAQQAEACHYRFQWQQS